MKLASALLTLSLCAPLVHAADAPKPEVLVKDSPQATAGGATFTAPASWTVLGSPSQRVLEGPEKDIRLAVVDVTAASADAPPSVAPPRSACWSRACARPATSARASPAGIR